MPQGELSAKEKLVLRLNAQYPGDVGVLAAFFLNLVQLRPMQVRFPALHSVACMGDSAWRLKRDLFGAGNILGCQ